MSTSRAFSVLRAASNDHDVPLRRLSGWVVELAERLPVAEEHRRSVHALLDRPFQPQPEAAVLERPA